MSSNSSSLTPTATVADVPPTSRVWPRIVLLAVAGFESWIGLEEFSEAFDLHDAPLSFGQFVINARLAIHPFFAIGALVFAAFGYRRYHCACRLHSGGLVLRIADYCAVRHRMGLVTGRTVAVGAATDLSAARCGSDRSCLFGQAFMAWRNFRRPAIGKSAFRRDHFYDRDHDLRILTATRRSKSGVP